MTRRCALYTRVSTEEQTSNHSLDTQATTLRAFADREGYHVAREYVDGGHSGARRDRPALARLLDDARAGLFDVVLLYRLDRLARSTHLAYTLLQELADAGVGVRSSSEPQIDSTTPMGKVSLGVTAIFAELERDTFMQRSRDGTRKAVEKGVYSGGITAYGYTTADKRLVVHEPEAEVVRLIYGWCVERGWSNIRIAEELTRLNIPTRYRLDGRGVRGKATASYWRAGGVLRILKSTTYKGEYRYGKRNTKAKAAGTHGVTVSSCPAIVTPEIWEAAQATLARNRLTATRNAKHTYMLRSLIRCGACGRTYIGTRGRGGYWYACNGRTLRGSTPKAHKCLNPYVRGPELEAEVWAGITRLLLDPRHALETRPASLAPPELPLVEQALADTRISRARLTDLYLDPRGGLSKADYLSRLAGLDKGLASLSARLSELRDVEAVRRERERRERDLLSLAERYRDQLEEADDLTRQTLAHHLLRGITVRGDGSVDVAWAL